MKADKKNLCLCCVTHSCIILSDHSIIPFHLATEKRVRIDFDVIFFFAFSGH